MTRLRNAGSLRTDSSVLCARPSEPRLRKHAAARCASSLPPLPPSLPPHTSYLNWRYNCWAASRADLQRPSPRRRRRQTRAAAARHTLRPESTRRRQWRAPAGRLWASLPLPSSQRALAGKAAAPRLTRRPSGRVWPGLAKYLHSNTRGLESSSHPQRPCLAPRHAQGSGAGQPPGGRAADREPVWREHRYQTRCMVLGDYWCARLPLARRPPTACPPPARRPPLPLLGGQAVAAPTKPGPRFELSRAGLSRSQREC